MKRETLALIFLILGILFLNYSSIDGFLIRNFNEIETGIVERVIDGDTIKINKTSVRLLGINTPEIGESYSYKAKEFLENEILNKTVHLKFGKEKYDLYDRKLAYVFIEGKNINEELVRKGYANFYFPKGNDLYSENIKKAWQNCLEENINLCEKSNQNCIILKNWDIKNQEVVLKNICINSVDISGWSVKDEGRKLYIFKNKILKPNEQVTLIPEDFGKTYVWTKLGDSIFIRDNENKLVYFDNY